MNPIISTVAATDAPPSANSPTLWTAWRRLWRPGESATQTQIDDAKTKEETAELHTAHAQSVFDFLYRRLGNRADAEDICAETFAAALTAWPRYRGDAAPRTFLLGIARNKLADFQRHRHRRETPASVLSAGAEDASHWLDNRIHPSATPEQAAQQAEARNEIRRLIDALPETQREAILLQYADNMTVAEIAAVLHRSPDAVTSLLQRARASLYKNGRAYFAPEGEEVN